MTSGASSCRRAGGSRIFIAVVITIVGALLRLKGLDQGIPDYHTWRQTDTAQIAMNFYRGGMKLFYPEVSFNGDEPGQVAMELPLLPWVVAVFYHLFGPHDVFGPILSVLAYIGASFSLYQLSARLVGGTAPLWSCLAMAILPLGLGYSRTFQPESTMILFSLLGLQYWAKWSDEESPRSALIGSLCVSVAVLLKPTNLYLGVPVACLVFRRLGGKFWRYPIVYLSALISVGPTILWWLHCYDFPIAFTPFWKFGLGEDKWGGSRVWFGGDLAYFWKHTLFHYVMVPSAGILSCLGWLKLNRMNAAALLGWFAGIVLFTFAISTGLLGHDYYRLPFIPLCSFWIGAGADLLWDRRHAWSRLIFRGVAIGMFVLVWRQCRPQIREYYHRGDPADFRRLVEITQKHAEPDDLIVWLSVWGHPELFYHADRRGWKMWEDFTDLPSSFLERTRRNLYAVVTASNPDDLDRILEQTRHGQDLKRFPLMERSGHNAVYALRSDRPLPTAGGPFQWVDRGEVLTDLLTSAPSAFIWTDGIINVIALGPNGKPWHAFFKPGEGWHANGEVLDDRLLFDPVGFVNSDGRVQMLGVSGNFKLWHAYRDNQMQWNSMGEVMLPMGFLAGAASGYASKDTPMSAFLLRSNERPGLSRSGVLMYAFRDDPSGWIGVDPESTTHLLSAPCGFPSSDGTTQVLARGPNEKLWHAFIDKRNRWNWVGEVLDDVLTSRPSGFVGSDGLIHVVALGASGRLWHAYRDSENKWRSSGEVLAEPLGSAPSAVLATDGTIHVFAQTQSHRLWEAVMRTEK